MVAKVRQILLIDPAVLEEAISLLKHENEETIQRFMRKAIAAEIDRRKGGPVVQTKEKRSSYPAMHSTTYTPMPSPGAVQESEEDFIERLETGRRLRDEAEMEAIRKAQPKPVKKNTPLPPEDHYAIPEDVLREEAEMAAAHKKQFALPPRKAAVPPDDDIPAFPRRENLQRG